LARGFETLKARVHDVSYTPGTDALRRIGPLLLQAQDLTATALARLNALDSSAYASLPGSRAGLELLASVVSSSSLAGTDLAHAVLANPYKGAQYAGYPADSEAIRTTRHANAIPQMTEHLDDAAHQLDLSATGCHYLAHGITKDLASAQDHHAAAGPSLTPTQHDALAALKNGGRLYESSTRGLGVTRIATDDGTRVSIATYRALAKRGLVTSDTSTSLFIGQKITVTKQGQQALTRPRAALTTAVATPPKAAVTQGAHR
jgi:DNA-binding MarR family transcriptional regulator